MPVLHTVRRIIKRRTNQRACSKHGPYTGPYCPQCYEKAMEDA